MSPEMRLWIRTSLAAAMLFVGLGLAVLHGPGAQFDMWMSQSVAGWRSQVLTALFSAATFIGNTDTMVVLSVTLLLVASLYRPVRRESLYVVALLIAVGVASPLLKSLYGRPRPPYALALTHETSFSFPSGHAMVSLCLFGFLAYLASSHLDGWQKRAAVALSALMVAIIGFSRIYLGVHYTCDVLAGYLAGLPVLVAAVLTHQRVTRVTRAAAEPVVESADRPHQAGA